MIKIAVLGLALGLGVAGAAHAAPVASALPLAISSLDVELVAGGCGPRGFRDRFGNCRPQRRHVAQRCPPGTRPTPAGCRRNY